ncbi:MAG: hypothetical protein KDD73_07785 [Anaerolineales bacterium]|nr:hypothetical protein [Anaerolineales bacterium]
MQKSPTFVRRNPENMREILDEAHPDCGWLFAGEGVATRKYDGTCVKIENGKYFKRREVGKGKPVPYGFIEADHDETTGKRVGWVEVEPSAPENKWHMAAFDGSLPDGTYELVGPKVQGNPEGYDDHRLIAHADAEQYEDAPRTFEALREWLPAHNIEGLVFHHPDGRMAKIKKRDFGLKRKP